MGNKLFGVDIAKELKAAMASGLLPMKLIKMVKGARDDANLAAGETLTPRAYTCRGILDDFTLKQREGTTWQYGDKTALILGDTLAKGIEPADNDRFEAEKKQYVIEAVLARDPAAATWLLHLRGG